uniref:Phospholipase A2 n=1 Tax=Plectus sambesii TaxID=2011161 RepID=A0A914WBA2_9BILA
MFARPHGLICIILAFTINVVCNTAATKLSPDVTALWNLRGMAKCKLHYNALAYNNYGCWCGVGGCCKPIDPIDDCCMHHDKCYEAAAAEGKCYRFPFAYFDPYAWRCDHGNIICGGNRSPCKAALCACDSAVVNCWARCHRPLGKPRCRH